ncbi:hypothetical protein SD77_0612 [Bacillus badius]|uniref:Uncharacterized protein n=1 Tax=Bacillus badius TaxID=1455 RepID=A0ABR5B1A4_BACBA|nr:hypothetical protein SD78_4159 [Bacillus badius]KIL80764.1 hypothetical protein SD77_0612 [Bacillus badius]
MKKFSKYDLFEKTKKILQLCGGQRKNFLGRTGHTEGFIRAFS